MIITIILSIMLMAGLFLMLWSAVGFIQDKRFFTSAPTAAREVIQPKAARFRGQRAVGWGMMLLALALTAGAIVVGAYDGMKRGFDLWRFFARFSIMQILLKAFDILFFDWFLLCRSNFFPHCYPEVKGIYGAEIFGYNKRSHLLQVAVMLWGSLLLAGICTFV